MSFFNGSALILILYIAAIFVFSIWGRSFKTIEDFVLARGKLGPYALGLSFASSYASASLFLGVNGWSYSWGESVLFYTVFIFGFTILGLLFFAMPEFLKLLFPGSFVMLVILAVISAAFTTVNALLVAVSAVISNDLYRKGSSLILGQRETGKRKDITLLVGRISIWVVGAAAVSIALTQQKSLTSLVWIGINGVLSGVAGPLITDTIRLYK